MSHLNAIWLILRQDCGCRMAGLARRSTFSRHSEYALASGVNPIVMHQVSCIDILADIQDPYRNLHEFVIRVVRRNTTVNMGFWLTFIPIMRIRRDVAESLEYILDTFVLWARAPPLELLGTPPPK